jgi:Zn-dependent metalloprotease
MKRSITRSRAGHVGWTSNPEEPDGRAAAIPAIFRFAIVALILANTALEASAQCDKGKQQQAIAALGSQVRIQLNNHHVPSWIVGPLGARISADPVQSAIAAIKARSDVFCASVDDTFVFRGRMENDKHGQTHVRITQRYHGLDVFGLELIVHMT